MKILFLVPYPTEGASNRVRVEQYIPYLESHGVKCTVRPFVNKRFFRILYRPHLYAEKMFWFFMSTINRLIDIVRALNYDIVFIHREAYPFGRPYLESILHRLKKPIVFDFDDAVFLPNTSEHNIYIERFKNPAKTDKLVKMSAHVIAGNEYLSRYALAHNKNVHIIPSCVDTEKYRPKEKAREGKEIVIGWLGSNTTKYFLYDIEDVFGELSKRYDNIILKVVGASFHSSKIGNIVNKEWALEKEVSDIQSFDIGIMPMPDNEWTRGKCGFKTILYMACGIPVVASPVGVNTKIIDDGVNGFLAQSKNEWVKVLCELIDNRDLREKIGRNGRNKVIEHYSVREYAPIFYDILQATFKESNKK